MPLDPDTLDHHVHGAVGDVGAAVSVALMHLGDRLGLYRAMSGAGPLTAAEVANRTSTRERYVREWLNNQAAGGQVSYNPDTDTYELADESAFLLADEDSPLFLGGLFDVMQSLYADTPRLEQAFRTGEGVGWGDHDHRLYSGTARFFRPGYVANLVQSWIPSLDGVEQCLQGGAQVADIGCGFGVTTILLAQAFPKSTFVGFDAHDASIAAARKAAAEAGVDHGLTFEVATAKDFSGRGYDLITFFDCLHDMGDPVGALRHASAALASGGTVMLVEPNAGDAIAENLHPRGRLFYGVSTMVCTPASCAQEVGLGLGAQAGEARWRQLFEEAGYRTLRRATETPFNLVLEAKV